MAGTLPAAALLLAMLVGCCSQAHSRRLSEVQHVASGPCTPIQVRCRRTEHVMPDLRFKCSAALTSPPAPLPAAACELDRQPDGNEGLLEDAGLQVGRPTCLPLFAACRAAAATNPLAAPQRQLSM